MALIKVMLVDDEIMAIEDIITLIDWEENGFEIVATTTSSQKALDLFHIYHPDVVFLDIKMPVIDGLELSSRLLKIDDTIKIVLLTAYKDFKYAKRAVELGVVNYLVKHEINKSSLKVQLRKIKNELLNQYEMNKIIKNQFLINILKGEDIEQWPLQSSVDFYCNSNNEYGLIIIKQDMPYLLKYFSDQEIQFSQFVEMENITHPKHLSSIDLLDYKNALVVLLLFEHIKSWQEKKDLLYKVAVSIMNNLKKMYPETTFSTIISRTFCNIKDMSTIFLNSYNLLANTMILKKSTFIYQNDHPRDTKKRYIKADQLVDNVLNKEGIDEVVVELEKAFETIGTFPDYNILSSFISSLLEYIEEMRREYGIPSLRELYKKGYLKLQQYTLDELKDWFIQQFQQLQNLKDPDFYTYTQKVQQAIMFIEKSYHLQIIRKDLADHLGISQVYISQLFKKETGKTFLDYLTHYRIKMAKNLLQNSDERVYVIAESVGYSSSQYFSQVFLKETGKSPLEYREEGVLDD